LEGTGLSFFYWLDKIKACRTAGRQNKKAGDEILSVLIP
jgi:hypothetical protein